MNEQSSVSDVVASVLFSGHDVIPVKHAIPYLKKRGYDEKLVCLELAMSTVWVSLTL